MVPGISSVAELEEMVAAFEPPITAQEARELGALQADPASACTTLLAARCVDWDGVPAKKSEEFLAMREAAACEGSEACRYAALCELRCPYHLSIRSPIQELARSPLR
jgi:hypothetical protein